MTGWLKCPCGKRHLPPPPRATQDAVERAAAMYGEQVHLYAQGLAAPPRDPFADLPLDPVTAARGGIRYGPQQWMVTEDPPTIRAMDSSTWAAVARGGVEWDNHDWENHDWAVGPGAPVWDPERDLRRRVQAREAADRAMARGQQRG